MKKIIMWLRALTGRHSVYNGTTCQISRSLYDVHDYGHFKGGGGVPSHFHAYRCWRCKKEFTI